MTNRVVAPKLDSDAPNGRALILIRKWTSIEEFAEQTEMGADSKEGFASMDENGNGKDGVGIEVHQLNLVIIVQAMEKAVVGKA